MTTLNSTDADPTPAHLTTSPAPDDPRPPARWRSPAPDDPRPPARWRSPAPDDPRPPAVPDSSTIGAGAPLTAESHVRIGGELAGRLLRSTRWQQ
jgi:hypothetical protein